MTTEENNEQGGCGLLSQDIPDADPANGAPVTGKNGKEKRKYTKKLYYIFDANNEIVGSGSTIGDINKRCRNFPDGSYTLMKHVADINIDTPVAKPVVSGLSIRASKKAVAS